MKGSEAVISEQCLLHLHKLALTVCQIKEVVLNYSDAARSYCKQGKGLVLAHKYYLQKMLHFNATNACFCHQKLNKSVPCRKFKNTAQ